MVVGWAEFGPSDLVGLCGEMARRLGRTILPDVGYRAAAQPGPTALGCGRPGAGVVLAADAVTRGGAPCRVVSSLTLVPVDNEGALWIAQGSAS